MSWLQRGVTYCRQVTGRVAAGCLTSQYQPPSQVLASQIQQVRCKSVGPNYKFEVPSPYKKPGPSRHGYQQKLYDGGPLPRGLPNKITSLKPYKPKNKWTPSRALFGRNDYIDILGDSDLRPRDLLKAPFWLRGFNGNEMQKLIRQMGAEGHRIEQIYPSHYKRNWKRIDFLYKKYNQRRGKRIKNVISKNQTY
ncbi:RM51-like protein [Mya arenaria]|uniref:Large ribosomal subunit protein mL51 n=1 Tax=Mya arenaria TaxID=6604 RepID=A0ABY7F1P8_MYAAR|nr:39S ribosomal protein L51, mitochondrial-like [Mya arenaria]WAR15012.1 RM51-like protein [Mya arenaria]